MQLLLPSTRGSWRLPDAQIHELSAINGTILELAAPNRGLVRSATLVEAGISRTVIAGRRRSGFLHRVCRGLDVVGSCSLDREQSLLVAALAAGGDAALTGVAALELHAFSRFLTKGSIRVLAPTARRSQFANVTIERSLGLAHGWVSPRPTLMSVPWTINDLGTELTRHQIANAIHDAQFRSVAVLDDIRAVHERYTHIAGHAVVGEALRLIDAGSAGTRSELEDRFLRLVVAAGVPMPLVNMHHWFGGQSFELDCWWPRHGWNVELDGGQHGRRSNVDRDRSQDTAVLASGAQVVRFGWFEVVEEPERALAWLRSHISGARA